MNFKDLIFDEFTSNNPYSTIERQGNTFSDELFIRKAKIYKILGPNDDRLQVQPLPEFMGIKDEELENLPIWPMFHKGTMITGDSIKDHSDETAEFVWCLCTRDFSVGYILGKVNNFGSGIKEEKFPDSYSWKDVKTFLQQRQACPLDFDYKNLIVVTFFASDKGGLINCYNRKTGDWVLLNTTGSVLTVQQKEIYMRVGSPPNPVSSGPVGFSMIRLTGDKIHMKSPNIELECNDLVLGHNSMNLVGTLTQGPIIGRNGVSGIPVPTIHV